MKTVWRWERRKEERKEGGKEWQKSISKYLNPVFKCRQRTLFPLFAPQKLPTEGLKVLWSCEQKSSGFNPCSDSHLQTAPKSSLATIKADRLRVADISKLGTAILIFIFSYSSSLLPFLFPFFSLNNLTSWVKSLTLPRSRNTTSGFTLRITQAGLEAGGWRGTAGAWSHLSPILKQEAS